MDLDAVFGCIAVALSLGLIVGLVLWSCRSIDRIARKGLGSAREILKDKRT